ncbi:Putative nitrogen regulatory protein P-II [hydrothermal vent metagenome]|uniref:Putative nitrogen regulatory protein P-II n=1 Tax=hydrothermal vent metagenome TaxID=652676 RepID=A0A1W1CUG7_9ZZZZ
MHFKLIITFTTNENTEKVLEASRKSGATGATTISSARGEGLEKHTTFFGLELESPTEIILSLVEEHLAREALENINASVGFEEDIGSGMSIIIDVEDAIGMKKHIQSLKENKNFKEKI